MASITSPGGIVSRFAAAGVMIPVTLFLTWYGEIGFALLIAACVVMLGREWARMCGVLPHTLTGWVLAIGAVIILLLAAAGDRYDLGLVAAVAMAGFMAGYFRTKLIFNTVMWFAAGALVLIPAGLAFVWLRNGTANGLELTLWLFMVVWTTDSAAYFVGKAIGGPLLAPRISPKKTWAGFFGGLAGATIMGFGFAAMVSPAAGGLAAAAGLIVGLASSAGDLLESQMKRHFNLKDSGGLIPGHGGFMDRLDSLLAATPVVAGLYLLGWRWI
jgi:phosphatidate cytidylyltransferase